MLWKLTVPTLPAFVPGNYTCLPTGPTVCALFVAACCTAAAIVRAVVELRAECNKMVEVRLLNTALTKSCRLDAFDTAQVSVNSHYEY